MVLMQQSGNRPEGIFFIFSIYTDIKDGKISTCESHNSHYAFSVDMLVVNLECNGAFVRTGCLSVCGIISPILFLELRLFSG